MEIPLDLWISQWILLVGIAPYPHYNSRNWFQETIMEVRRTKVLPAGVYEITIDAMTKIVFVTATETIYRTHGDKCDITTTNPNRCSAIHKCHGYLTVDASGGIDYIYEINNNDLFLYGFPYDTSIRVPTNHLPRFKLRGLIPLG